MQWQQLIHKTGKLTSAPLFVDDYTGFIHLGVKGKMAVGLKAQNDVQLIVRGLPAAHVRRQ